MLSLPTYVKRSAEGAVMGKYDPLREHLVSQIGNVNEVEMSFAAIEGFVGR